jgi:hypothetical protein
MPQRKPSSLLRGVTATTPSVVSAEDQTTIRVRKEAQEELRIVAALEGRTIFAITDALLTEYLRRYETAIGRPLLPQGRKKTPTA